MNGGTISARTDASKFSPIVQQAIGDSSGNESQADLSTLAKSSELPTFVVAIERDGHWYVSAMYTALEYIRESNDLPAADFGSGLRAAATLGADSPEAAVDQGLQALAQNDWTKLIALAPPSELPVYDYRVALTELGRDTTTDLTIATHEAHATVNGDTAKVTLKASGTTDSGTWSVDGGCFKPPIDAEANVTLTGNQDWCSSLPALYLLPYFGMKPEVARANTITTVQRQGRWFISPVGTVLDLVDSWVNQVTQRQMYSMLGAPQRLPADATLSLGAPVNVGEPGTGASVFALDGRKGQRVLGIVTAPKGFEGSSPEVRAFTPDGTLMADSFDITNGRGLLLPANGTYKLVVYPYGDGQTLTVWDAATAPDAAKHPPNAGTYDGCHPTANGGTTCSASSSSSSSSPSSTSSSSSEGSCITDANGDTVCRSEVGSSGSSSSGSASTPTTVVPGPGG